MKDGTSQKHAETVSASIFAVTFMWPAKGHIIAEFGAKSGKTKNKGIDIRVEEGTPVYASSSGRVVFCDSRFKGLGKTVIIDHGSNYQTVYSYNSEILVRVGDLVRQHDIIARAGRSGRAKEPSLHFEIRKDGEAKNPVPFLPST